MESASFIVNQIKLLFGDIIKIYIYRYFILKYVQFPNVYLYIVHKF